MVIFSSERLRAEGACYALGRAIPDRVRSGRYERSALRAGRSANGAIKSERFECFPLLLKTERIVASLAVQ